MPKTTLVDDDEEEDVGILVDKAAVVMLDRATQWIDVYPKASKTTEHTKEALQHHAGPKDTISSFYCDNAPELV